MTLRIHKLPELFLIVSSILYVLISALRAPYIIDGDEGFYAKVAQQFMNQQSLSMNYLKTPSPQDLSKDTETRPCHDSLGTTLCYTLLFATCIPLGPGAKFISLFCFLLGSIAFFKIARSLNTSAISQWMLSVLLFAYYLHWLGGNAFDSNIFPFAIMPWQLFWTFKLLENFHNKTPSQRNKNILALGLLTGLSYWFNLSGFIPSLALQLALGSWILLKTTPIRIFHRVQTILFLILGILIPLTINQCLTGSFGNINNTPKSFTIIHIIINALSSLGSPGIWLFNIGAPIHHTILILKSCIPSLSILSNNSIQLTHLGWTGIPLTLLIAWSFLRIHKTYPEYPIPILSLLIIFTLIMLNFAGAPSINTHWALGFMPLVALIVLEAVKVFLPTISKNYLYSILFFITCFTPSLSLIGVEIKNSLFNQTSANYHTTPNKLYYSYLPCLPETVNLVDSLQTSPMDIVSVAHNGVHYGALLEFTQRTLPITSTCNLKEQLHIPPNSTFITNHPLRIILIATQEFSSNPKKLNQLFKRFPQAKIWYDETIESNGPTVFWADLMPPE